MDAGTLLTHCLVPICFNHFWNFVDENCSPLFDTTMDATPKLAKDFLTMHIVPDAVTFL